MPTIGPEPTHIKTESRDDIAEVVLMPGDPLRAKYIADNFLENAKLVTSIRNMLGFTGTYKGVKVTVMASGMGMPSMGIYAFELFHFYNVQKIIRIGTCGAVSPAVNVKDIILCSRTFTESNFGFSYNGFEGQIVDANRELNDSVLKAAKELQMEDKVHYGMLTTTDVYGPYVDIEKVLQRIPIEFHILGEEMEAYALIHIANTMKRKATAVVTVVSSKYTNMVLTPEQRQTSLNEMITLALESIIK